MLNKRNKGGEVHAIFALIILTLSIIVFFIPILTIGLLKLIPYKPLNKWCARIIDKLVVYWCDLNNKYINFKTLSHFECEGLDNIDRNEWQLVVANHQSWLDIVVLQWVLNRKIPVLKFFVKDNLKWIPFLGFAWWVMGCPFMKRYSKEYLSKNPHKKGKDIQSTLKAIESFKKTPASIMSFIEGTRFTPTKKEIQQSPYQHLLKPKSGGIGFVLSTMGKHFDNLLDITIIYPEKNYSLWDFLCKRIPTIKVSIRKLPIPEAFTQPEMIEDANIQLQFRDWINTIWAEKDKIAMELKA